MEAKLLLNDQKDDMDYLTGHISGMKKISKSRRTIEIQQDYKHRINRIKSRHPQLIEVAAAKYEKKYEKIKKEKIKAYKRLQTWFDSDNSIDTNTKSSKKSKKRKNKCTRTI